MMSVLKEILEEIAPYDAQLVAVSKTKPNEQILDLYREGQRIFGENRVQELVRKHEELPSDIEWHMIGHLQRNKVKYIASFVELIHSVDSLKLLREIDKQAAKNTRTISCLLEIKVAKELTKAGLHESEVTILLDTLLQEPLPNIRIRGVMGMATFTDDTEQVRDEFRRLKGIFDRIKESYFVDDDNFSIISMGMSGDYKIALEEGSTMIRVGTKLFGAR